MGVPMYDIEEAWHGTIFLSPALEELAKKTRSVCFGSLAQRSVVSRETINSFLERCPTGRDKCKIFDVNLRQGFYTKEILCNSMSRCNIFKINDEELVTVSRMFGYPGIDLQDKCWILLAKYNLKMLILTCGERQLCVYSGCDFLSRRRPRWRWRTRLVRVTRSRQPSPLPFFSGKQVPDAHKLAVEVSAYVCTQNGAMPELPVALKERLA